VTVRHYCQGIGDCHLIRFPKSDGSDAWMLIDCGVHSAVAGGTSTIARIVADIAERTGGRLDIVVVTHEHWDHVSGFLTAAETFGRLSVGEVWMGWTEDPDDPDAQALDRFRSDALSVLQAASAAFDRARGLSPFHVGIARGVDAVLGFNFGAKGERVRSARDAAKSLAPRRTRYLDPRTMPPLTIPGVPNLRIYLLGPPRDPALLGITERASEMYGAAPAAGWPLARALGGALNAGEDAAAGDHATPFEPNVGTGLSGLASGEAGPDIDPTVAAFFRDRYGAPDDDALAWRRIDADWLGASADLALQLDNRTNNTSLALAFEMVDSGRVLLFAADAQVGNWLSWHALEWTVDGRTVTAADLLSRTAHFKVGHHGSHNATLKDKGLALMTSPDLTAFIPTSEKDARKIGWGAMPFPEIVEELTRRTGGRIVRADDAWLTDADGQAPFTAPSGAVRAVRHGAGLWVEFELT
jgi:hypothetical protein